MSTYSMQELGPDNLQSTKVAWPEHLESTVCMLPHSFIPLLTTNIPPSSSDISRIREFQASVLESLTQEQTKGCPELGNDTYILQLEKQSFACDVMLSPFRHLPNDILYRIAVHSPRYIRQPSQHGSHPRVSHFPSVLAQVSRGWHGVVCGMSSMWSEIRVGSVHWHTENIEALQKRCTTFARLSGALPLSIELGQFPPPGMAQPYWESQRGFLKALDWVWNKWDGRPSINKLSLSVDEDPYIIDQSLKVLRPDQIDVDQPRDKTLELKSLRIYTFCDDEARNHDIDDRNSLGDIITQYFNSFPQLQQFSFDSLGHADLFNCHEFSRSNAWLAMKMIHLEPSLSCSDLWVLLSACPNLEVGSLTIYVNAPFDDWLDAIPSVHEALKELELTFLLSPESPEDAFSLTTMQLPNLHRLAVECCTASPVLDMEDVKPVDASAFADVFPAVETFEVKYMWTNLQQTLEFYLPILEATPSIRFVRVVLFGLLQLQTALEFFEEHCSTKGEEFLPQLKHVILEVSPGCDFDFLDKERRDQIASTVLMGLSSRKDAKSDFTSNFGDEESESQDVEGSYHTTVRYICGKDRNERNMAELACFVDWANRFPQVQGLTNVSSGVAVEVVKVQERDKYDIHEKEIFRRFES